MYYEMGLGYLHWFIFKFVVYGFTYDQGLPDLCVC